jgi:hypothetical protein
MKRKYNSEILEKDVKFIEVKSKLKYPEIFI